MALEGDGYLTPRPAHFTPRMTQYPFYKRLGGPPPPEPVWMDAENLAPPEFESRIFQPMTCRYADYAIPAHNNNNNVC
jgi:hypothetical protein